MTDTVWHVHGKDCEEVRDLVRRLERLGHTVFHCVSPSRTEPLVVGPEPEARVIKGEEIDKIFFVP